MPRLLFPWKGSPIPVIKGGWMGPREGLGAVKEKKYVSAGN
jgi:hypothetical protein